MISSRYVAAGLLLLSSAVASAQLSIPKAPTVPSVPTAPSVPAVPSVPTAPTVPTVPTSASDAATQAQNAQKTADQVKKATGKDKDKDKDAKPEEPGKPGSVGVALSRLMDQVNVSETTASAAGNAAAMEAGRDIAIAISNTQNVYEDDLNKDLSGKISPNIKTTVDQLQNAMTQLDLMTKASLQVASTAAEQVSNELPYRLQEPKLVRFTPRFLVPSKDTYVVKVHFSGKFDYATKPEFFPTLMIHDHTYKPVQSSATDIEFGVPITDIFPAGTSSKQLQFVITTLKMPWELTSMMGKHHKKEDNNFKLFMAALPSGPGTVKYIAKATRMEAGVPQRHIGAPYHQCSGRCGADDVNHLWTEQPDTGCSVVKGTSTFDVTNSGGGYKKEFLGDGGEGASYSVTTAKQGSANQFVDFTISFQETCSKEVPNNIGDEVAMQWGATQSIKATEGSWKVSLDAFDGTHTDFSKTDATNLFLKVTGTPDGVTLATPDPATLVWPPAATQ